MVKKISKNLISALISFHISMNNKKVTRSFTKKYFEIYLLTVTYYSVFIETLILLDMKSEEEKSNWYNPFMYSSEETGHSH